MDMQILQQINHWAACARLTSECSSVVHADLLEKVADHITSIESQLEAAEKNNIEIQRDRDVWQSTAFALRDDMKAQIERAEAAEARLLVPDGWNELGPTYPDHYKPILVAMNGIVQHITYQIEEGDNGDYWQPVSNEGAEGAPITQFQHWKSLPAAPVNPVEGGEQWLIN